MYNPEDAANEPDWRNSSDYQKYKHFVLYVHRYINPANEKESDLYHMADSGTVVFYPHLPGHEDRPYDQLQLQAVESFKEVLDKHAQGEWSHGLPRAAHINRDHGRQQVVLFDYKLNPNAKTSIKGTVLDSIAMNNQLNPDGKESCGHDATLTPVVLSPDSATEGSETSGGKKKNRRNRKKKKEEDAANGEEEMNGKDCNQEKHEIHNTCGHQKRQVLEINQIDPNCSVHGHGNRVCGMDYNSGGHGPHPPVVTKDRKTQHIHVSCTKCGKNYTQNIPPQQRREKHILVRKPVKGGEGKEVALHMVTSNKPQVNPHCHQVSFRCLIVALRL